MYETERNPQYRFVSTDPDAIMAEFVAEYEDRFGKAVQPASSEQLLIAWMVEREVQHRVLLNYVANQNIPSRASGENLDALAELYYIDKRSEETPASCTVRFELTTALDHQVLIPGGTRVTDTSRTLYWETQEDVYIRAGSMSVEALVVCQTPGTQGNGWKPGQLSELVDIYEFYKSVTNITESDGGAHRMTDEELYNEMVLSMYALSTAGPQKGYVYHAKKVSTEIEDVVATTPSPGVVNIFCLMKDGEPAGEEIKRQVLEACSADNVRPMTDKVEMADPKEIEYNINLTYYIPRTATQPSSEIEKAVTEKVDEFVKWQGGRLGRDINPSELIKRIMETGVKRVHVEEPVYKVLYNGNASGEDEYGKPPELAKLKDRTVLNGGFEDE